MEDKVTETSNSTDDTDTDRISDLPDHILHRILSFFPTDFLVKTSVLSKRWRYLWTSIPNLDFDQKSLYKKMWFGLKEQRIDFTEFVNRVLSFRDASSIQKFRLNCCFYNCNCFYVDAWIQYATRRNVQELDITLTKTFEWPQYLFHCKSLKVLRLTLISGILKLSSLESLNSLEILFLEGIKFVDDKIGDLISYYCPLLKNLTLRCCSGLKNLNISSMGLETLSLKFAFSDERDMSVNISAPNLQFLEWQGDIVKNYSVEYPKSILQAHIEFNDCDTMNKCIWDTSLYMLLCGLSNVRTLEVSRTCIESLCGWKDAPNVLSTPLTNLSYMKLHVDPDIFALPGITCLINIAPNLQKLDIIIDVDPTVSMIRTCYSNFRRGKNLLSGSAEVMGASSSDVHEYWEPQNLTNTALSVRDELEMHCFWGLMANIRLRRSTSSFDGDDYWEAHNLATTPPFDNLEEVDIKCFQGLMNEMKLVKFLLQNAVHLKKMVIFFSENICANLGKRIEISEKLLQLSKASSNATLLFL